MDTTCNPGRTVAVAHEARLAINEVTRRFPGVKLCLLIELPCECFVIEGTGHTEQLIDRWKVETRRPPDIGRAPIKA